MALRIPATYIVMPHSSNRRKHYVPIEAARLITNDPEALGTCLDERPCLVEITVIEGSTVLARIPKTLVLPSSGNEIYCTLEKFPTYPTTLSSSAMLVVEMVIL